jgi:AcrR family transcriptional regulator
VSGIAVAQRIDAVRNRRALVAAAEHIFAEVGPDAPLDLVAKRARVGRGTLYRHFRDRIDLAAAVYEEHLTELEAYVAERANEPSIALELMTRVAELQGNARGIQPLLLRAATGRERLATLNQRTRDLLAGPLATSQQACTPLAHRGPGRREARLPARPPGPRLGPRGDAARLLGACRGALSARAARPARKCESGVTEV